MFCWLHSAVEGHKSAPAVWEAHLSFSVAPKSAGNSTDTATAAALAMAEILEDDMQEDDGSSNPTQGPGGDDGGETDGESADSCDADGEGTTAAERQQAAAEHDAALWRYIRALFYASMRCVRDSVRCIANERVARNSHYLMHAILLSVFV